MNLRGILCLAFAVAGAAAPGAEPKQPEAAPPPAPLQVWSNSKPVADIVELKEAAKGVAYILLGKDGKPFRSLRPDIIGARTVLGLPPQSTVQAWQASELAKRTDTPFAASAKWGAWPAIYVGPYAELPREIATDTPREVTPWRDSVALFRAYPEGPIEVVVRVRNGGTSVWKQPRVRLFAPDSWQVTPAVAPLVPFDAKKPSKNIEPMVTGIASFTVTIPRNATLNQASPLFAFLRFNVGKQEVTVQNSIDVRVLEPIERRYGMDEEGRRFVVHLINRFKPANIGSPVVEVRQPSGADWGLVQPAIEPLQHDRDAVTVLTKRANPPDPFGIPVVVTLNGLRMGYTPTVSASIALGKDGKDRGITISGKERPAASAGDDGLVLAGTPTATLSLDVTDRFAVSDPKQWVSPTWVTVSMADAGQGRIRLEYDAYGTEGTVVAADIPLPAPTGETLSFLLPDARFQGHLANKPDIRIVVTGRAVIREVRATKWNPLKSR
jgi:hypothetical protein